MQKNRAKSLMKKIESFECIMSMIIWGNVLKPLSIVSKVLQSPQIHLYKVCELLKKTVLSITKMRNNHEEFVASASELRFKWGMSIRKPTKRKIFSKQYFGEIQGHRRLDVLEEKFR